MEKNKKVLPIMLASALASTPFVAAPQAYAVSKVSVDTSDDGVEESADYTIDFTLEEDLDAGDDIIVSFDSDFDLDDVDESDVEIDGVSIDSVEIDTDNNEIIITVDEEVEGDEEYTITIDNVVNPDEEGDYDIDVEAENDDDTGYDTIEIVDEDDDSSEEEFSVDMDDDEEDAETGYVLGPIDLETDLEEGNIVYVTFPDEDMLPSRMNTEDVEINGYEVADVEIDGDTVELEIPDDVDGQDELEIEFFEDAGITNPTADDGYTFEVEYEDVTYYSEEFEITEKSGSSNSGGDSDFTVSLSDTTAGARSSYTFEADFGKKELEAGDDVIVEFPSSEMLPGIWSASDVTVNGKAAKSVYSSGNKVYITAPSSFTSTSDVKVSFSYSAWVTNPKTAGDYSLKMTVDGKSITSKSFKITGATYTPAPTPVPPVPVNNATATIGLTNSALNAVTGVNVAIKGVGVPLAKQRDFIELVFPVGYRIPAYITPSAVTVNGVMASYVAVRGQNVLVYPSQDIPSAAAANVVISPSANIVNPAVKNAYSISVFTSEEKGLLFARAVSVGGAPVVKPPATPQPGVVIPANAARIKLNVASFTLHGKTYPLQAAPALANGNTTVVPAQFFKEALALTTQWNNQTVAIISGTKVLRFTVGSNKAKVGGQEVTLPAAVQLKNNMPMIPIKFVADNLGYKLGWDAKTSTVFIYR